MLTKLTSKPDFIDYVSLRCYEECPDAPFKIEGKLTQRRCVRPFEPEHEVHYFVVRMKTADGEMDQWYAWTT